MIAHKNVEWVAQYGSIFILHNSQGTYTGTDPGFGQRGASVSEAKSCLCSSVELAREASYLQLGYRAWKLLGF